VVTQTRTVVATRKTTRTLLSQRTNSLLGVQIGATGTFPPQFRSGLGEKSRFLVPANSIRFGQTNVIAVRTYMKDARSNFLVAAPILL